MAAVPPSRSLAVIGGGVVGLSVAAAAADGWRVVVIDAADDVCAVASGASFAWANADAKVAGSYAALSRAALDRHRDLSAAASEPWYRPLPARVDGRIVEEGGIVEVAAFARSHVGRIRAAGGAVRTRTRVTRLAQTPSGASLVLDGRQELRVDRVVVAAGCDTPKLLADLGAVPPAVGSATGPRGFVVRARRTDAAAVEVRLGERFSVRPETDRLILLQSRALERDLDAEGVPFSASAVWPRIRSEAAAAGFDVADADLVSVASATRPATTDGLPVVGEVTPGVHVVLAHSGVTLAPLLGELAAAGLDDGDPHAASPLRPDRPIPPDDLPKEFPS
ncbi:NAD(P)/FAD-dependent oxidoreductase [Microbacterium sp. RD1]|uniref:NAD(P)/FAD-dependent oxidoreductase n=1 Tax=Microbacterium sp. RD1 TaxID=3457313 RepID=UPI003FA5F8BE